MDMYTIIEDCSPYYIRFTFDGLPNIIEYVKSLPSNGSHQYKGYYHETYDISTAESIVSKLPMAQAINFNIEKVSKFTTMPGGGCGIHKDGINRRMSLNIPIRILDNKCITSWYDDKQFEGMPFVGDTNYTRNVYRFQELVESNKFTPVKTMVAQPNEMILFNTDIFHSWFNVDSDNTREMLILTVINRDTFYFDDAKKILFGN